METPTTFNNDIILFRDTPSSSSDAADNVASDEKNTVLGKKIEGADAGGDEIEDLLGELESILEEEEEEEAGKRLACYSSCDGCEDDKDSEEDSSDDSDGYDRKLHQLHRALNQLKEALDDLESDEQSLSALSDDEADTEEESDGSFPYVAGEQEEGPRAGLFVIQQGAPVHVEVSEDEQQEVELSVEQVQVSDSSSLMSINDSSPAESDTEPTQNEAPQLDEAAPRGPSPTVLRRAEINQEVAQIAQSVNVRNAIGFFRNHIENLHPHPLRPRAPVPAPGPAPRPALRISNVVVPESAPSTSSTSSSTSLPQHLTHLQQDVSPAENPELASLARNTLVSSVLRGASSFRSSLEGLLGARLTGPSLPPPQTTTRMASDHSDAAMEDSWDEEDSTEHERSDSSVSFSARPAVRSDPQLAPLTQIDVVQVDNSLMGSLHRSLIARRQQVGQRHDAPLQSSQPQTQQQVQPAPGAIHEVDPDAHQRPRPASEENPQEVRARILFRRERLTAPPPQHGARGQNPLLLSRETVRDEISTLVNQRLVSQIMTTDFPRLLERAVTRRRPNPPNGSGPSSPRQRRSQPSTIPPPTVVRVDGAPTPSSSSTTSSRRGASNTNMLDMERRIHDLCAQMTELTRVVNLSFELQLDIQRSVRQEVTAALSLATRQDPALVLPPLSSHRPSTNDNCLICLDRGADTLLYRCGHLCCCNLCARDLMTRGHRCPMCRAPIDDIVRAYKP